VFWKQEITCFFTVNDNSYMVFHLGCHITEWFFLSVHPGWVCKLNLE